MSPRWRRKRLRAIPLIKQPRSRQRRSRSLRLCPRLLPRRSRPKRSEADRREPTDGLPAIATTIALPTRQAGRPETKALSLLRGADHMNYSIRYLNERGVTERSEFLAMESDAAADDHARLDLPRYFMVELW